jgi:hypothetical protein
MEALVIMADTIEVDLAAVKAALHDRLSFRSNGLQGCLPKVGIRTEDLAALLTGDLGRIDSVVRPFEFGPAILTAK